MERIFMYVCMCIYSIMKGQEGRDVSICVGVCKATRINKLVVSAMTAVLVGLII